MNIPKGTLSLDTCFVIQDGTKMKVKAMEPKLHDRLEVIKAKRPDLINPETEVQEEYGVSRSFRLGSTLVATNHGVPNHVIELN
jgi:hypothetical protein